MSHTDSNCSHARSLVLTHTAYSVPQYYTKIHSISPSGATGAPKQGVLKLVHDYNERHTLWTVHNLRSLSAVEPIEQGTHVYLQHLETGLWVNDAQTQLEGSKQTVWLQRVTPPTLRCLLPEKERGHRQ